MIIDSIHVRGFRSLGDTRVNKLGPVNILYGENNAGKSNILAALETLFRVENVEQLESPVGVFLQGGLSNFVDNFTLKNSGERVSTISMGVRLLLDEKDLKQIEYFTDLIKTAKFHNKKRKKIIYEQGHKQRVDIEAEIVPLKASKALRSIKGANVNDTVIYDPTKPESERFFAELSAEGEVRQKSAEQLFRYLMNSFSIIRAGRLLAEESVLEGQAASTLEDNLKKRILRLSQSRGIDYQTYQEIARLFNETPFKYGVVRPFVEGGSAGLIVKDNANRELVIERKGTGVQQVLMLLCNIVCSKAKILGIEEIELNLSPSLQNKLLTLLKAMVGKNADGSLSQLILTSHSMHLSKREDTVLYAVERDDIEGNTQVTWGPKAISRLKSHFDYGLIKLPSKRIWR